MNSCFERLNLVGTSSTSSPISPEVCDEVGLVPANYPKHFARTRIAVIFALLLLLSHDIVLAEPLTYVVTSDGRFGQLDEGNGAFYQIGGYLASGCSGLGSLADGTLVTVDRNGALWRMDTNIGAAYVIGATGVHFSTFSSIGSGALYGIDYADNLYRIDGATAAATLIGATGLPNLSDGSWDNALAGNATSLYYIFQSTSPTIHSSTLYQLNLTTGAATAIGHTGTTNLVGAGFAHGVLYAYNGDFGLYPTLATQHIFSIDLSTGTATQGSTYSSGYELFGSSDAVPEPPEHLLLLPGLLALFWFRIIGCPKLRSPGL